ncbi:MAG: hypothetical protein BAJALOKI1v1_70005 [Promethearchaeota archaeon]|nr:MAG: hypothetical protein BAJALOKI1v1_70005 [Candidatus Lokiarchaeota archaeon]
MSGVLLLAFGIVGLVLGILARRVRRRALQSESNNVLIKSAGIFSILGIILSIAGAILGGLFSYLPFFISMRNLLPLNFY